MARKKRVTRREAARRSKIRKGLRKYWRRVKKVKKKHSTTLKRARRLVKSGVGRTKKERKRAQKKKDRRRIRAFGTLWTGEEYVISFEENQRGQIDIPKRRLTYSADVEYRDQGADDEEDVLFQDGFSWDAKGEDEFWGGWWVALKDWLNTMVDFFPESFAVDKSPQKGSVVVVKVTFAKPEE
jgi:hypothetical protein